MTFDALLSWTLLSIGLVIVPGPDTVLAVNYAVRRGFKDALSAVIGGTVGGLWYVGLCGFGFLSVLTAYPSLYTAVKLAGAAYLAWLGLKMVRGALNPVEQSTAHADQRVANRPFVQGLLTTALNPKIALFLLAILPQFVGAGSDAPYWGMLLITIMYLIGLVWLSGVAFFASRAGRAARQSNFARWLEGVLGVAFMGFAGRLALSRD